MEIQIDFDINVFLPKYRHLVNSDADVFVLWGGRDSGKSHFIAQALIKECLESGYFKCILSRKIQDTIKESQWETIKTIVEDWGLSELFDFVSSPLEIRCSNGNKFIARGADAKGKVKGVANPTHVWFEELNQMTEQEFKVVSTTLRTSKGRTREYWSFNPECEGDYNDFWLYKIVGENYRTYSDTREIKVADEQVQIKYEFVHSTYEDNDYCPSERRAKYINQTQGDDYLYGVWIRGWWGQKEVLRPFAFAYDERKHVADVELIPGARICIVVDFNLDPFCANLYQMYRANGEPYCEQFAEIEIPNGSIEAMGERLRTLLGHSIRGASMTGDAMGSNRTIGRVDNASLFSQLLTACGMAKSQFVKISNPTHGVSREQCNYFLHHFPNFKIHTECTGTRRDMRTVQVDAFNHIIKKNRKDESQRADMLDNFRYCVNAYFKKDIERHKISGRWL